MLFCHFLTLSEVHLIYLHSQSCWLAGLHLNTTIFKLESLKNDLQNFSPTKVNKLAVKLYSETLLHGEPLFHHHLKPTLFFKCMFILLMNLSLNIYFNGNNVFSWYHCQAKDPWVLFFIWHKIEKTKQTELSEIL